MIFLGTHSGRFTGITLNDLVTAGEGQEGRLFMGGGGARRKR